MKNRHNFDPKNKKRKKGRNGICLFINFRNQRRGIELSNFLLKKKFSNSLTKIYRLLSVCLFHFLTRQQRLIKQLILQRRENTTSVHLPATSLHFSISPKRTSLGRRKPNGLRILLNKSKFFFFLNSVICFRENS